MVFFLFMLLFFRGGGEGGVTDLQFVSHWETVVVLAEYKSTAIENIEGIVAILD